MNGVERGPAPAPFVGRRREFDLLRARLADVTATRRGTCVAILGDVGIGKTTLCESFADEADVRVAWTRCWPDRDAPPMWPWNDVLQQLGIRTDAAADAPSSRFDACSAIADQLSRLDEPSLVVIDDHHVASADTIAATQFIAGRIRNAPLLLAVTMRQPNGDGAAALISAIAENGSVIRLQPLDVTDVAAWRESRRLGDGDDVALTQRSGGNPLFLRLLAEHVGFGDDTIPLGAEAIIRPRLARLDADQRRLLEALAVFGSPAPLVALANLIESNPSQTAAAAATLPDLLAADDRTIGFIHGLVQEFVIDTVPADIRLDWHARSSALLETAGDEFALRRARHALAAAVRSDADAEDAVALVADLVDHLPNLAFDQRAQLLAEAMTVEQDCLLRPPAAAIRLAHADAVLASGQLARARELYRSIAETTADSADARTFGRAVLGLGGVWVEDERLPSERRRMLTWCRDAIDRLGSTEPVLRAQLEIRLAAESHYDGNGSAEVHRWIDTLRDLGDHRALAESLSLLHHTMLVPEFAVERLTIADEMIAAATAAGSDLHQVLGMCWRTVDLYLLGDRSAERALADTYSRAETLGSRSALYVLGVMEVMRVARSGDLAAAEALAGDVFSVGTEIGDADALGYYSGQILAIRWMQGRELELLDTVAEITASPTLREHDAIYPALHAMLLAQAGRHAESRPVLDDLLTDGLGSLSRNGNWLATMCILVECAHWLDDRGLAAQLIGVLEPYIDLPVLASLAVCCLGPVARFSARAAAVIGDHDRALRLLEQAQIVNLRLANRPLDPIIAADTAIVLLRRGHPDDRHSATKMLRDAVDRAAQIDLSARVDVWQHELDRTVRDGDTPEVSPNTDGHAGRHELRRIDDSWIVNYGSSEVTVPHAVGMTYLATLLARPNIEISALDLSTVGLQPASFQPALDRTALSEYHDRLGMIDAELSEAESHRDSARHDVLLEEREQLLAELRRSVGLHARPRPMDDDAERARSRVSKAIRRSIERLGEGHAALGYELAATIRTGQFCCYAPRGGRPTTWTVHA